MQPALARFESSPALTTALHACCLQVQGGRRGAPRVPRNPWRTLQGSGTTSCHPCPPRATRLPFILTLPQPLGRTHPHLSEATWAPPRAPRRQKARTTLAVDVDVEGLLAIDVARRASRDVTRRRASKSCKRSSGPQAERSSGDASWASFPKPSANLRRVARQAARLDDDRPVPGLRRTSASTSCARRSWTGLP